MRFIKLNPNTRINTETLQLKTIVYSEIILLIHFMKQSSPSQTSGRNLPGFSFIKRFLLVIV